MEYPVEARFHVKSASLSEATCYDEASYEAGFFLALAGGTDFRHDFRRQRELAVHDLDDRHALLRDVLTVGEGDRSGDAGEVLRRQQRLLNVGRVGRTSALNGVRQQLDGVIAERGESVLRRVTVFVGVGGDERLDRRPCRVRSPSARGW